MAKLVNEAARILENECVGPNLYLMTCASPQIARDIQPGQFVHMKVPRMEDHILRRPFSVYARDVKAGTIDILYQVVGFGSDHMTSLAAGEECEFIGPVGHGWHAPEGASRVLLVAGGVGAAPLFMLAEQLVGAGVRTDVVLGAQTHAALVTHARYEDVLARGAGCGCVGARCATDDGSFGRPGFCTSLVEEALAEAKAEGLPYDYLAVCGPEPLMRIVAGLAAAAEVPCEVSMERRMACGVGACLSCVVDTTEGKQRSCVDGPVFPAEKVVW